MTYFDFSGWWKNCWGSFFRDNIHFPPSNSDELRAHELTSAFQTAKMASHYRHTDDSMDYFTFNMLSAVFCTGSFRGMGKKINKSPNSNSTEPEKVMPYERARAGPEKFWLPDEKGNLHPRGKRAIHSCPHERHWLSVSKWEPASLEEWSRGLDCCDWAAAPLARTIKTELSHISCDWQNFCSSCLASVNRNQLAMMLRVLP